MAKRKSETIEVGQIIGFHGIKGEMKVKSFSDNPKRFADLDSVLIDGIPYELESAREQKGYAFIKLKKITDRTAAESFRNKILEIQRDQDQELEEDEYYVVDLIGYQVKDKNTGEEIGNLKDILQTSGPVDTFIIDTGSKQVYIPALKEYFQIDPSNKIILAQIPEEFFEL